MLRATTLQKVLPIALLILSSASQASLVSAGTNFGPAMDLKVETFAPWR